ncbi:unnamed protein product [Cladocopium goreaui]|uniref:Uncharacterized protein n=1 Tax=Cladocopium goreaui TaxID=2562237 RepID=A0A9P1G7Z5_9DINO|nr:unnamed protein product [Cladocopium goreaui]
MEAQCSDNSGTPGTPCSTLQVHVVIVGPVWGEPFTARERMEISLKHGQRCPGFSGVDSGSIAILEEDNPQWKQEPFKLSKFKRVRAKVTSFRQKSEAAEILDLDIAAQMNEEDPRSKMDSDKLPRDEAEDGLAEH